MLNRRSIAVALIVLAAAACRLVPHVPNVTPIIAVGVFGGAYLRNTFWAFVVVFVSMFVSDLVLGLHSTMFFVYTSLFLAIFAGSIVKDKSGFLPLLTVTCASSTVFFVWTNFGVWLVEGLYPKTLSGLLLCYGAAIPFYVTQLIGDAFFISLLFAVFLVFEKLYFLQQPRYVMRNAS
ncbi:MAG: hypothetical protein IT291_08530 [Deltaproteobacteria bacterium]|nr:hypothetical protein [Deltaproteobacteria bacterium]